MKKVKVLVFSLWWCTSGVSRPHDLARHDWAALKWRPFGGKTVLFKYT